MSRRVRCVLRLEVELRDVIDTIAARIRGETGGRVSRAAILCAMAIRQIRQIDPFVPFKEQLPLNEAQRRFQPPARPRPRGRVTMRANIIAAMAASPGEVFTTARLARLVNAASRDSVRNTLLVLAERRRIEKVGPGQYRARARASIVAAQPPTFCIAGPRP
jgi:hypothetical protein